MRYSACTRCGEKIHLSDELALCDKHVHFPVRWFTAKGHLCTGNADHVPQEKEVSCMADSDTITVEELRAAGRRLRIPGFPSTYTRMEEALEDILAHREPEYIPGKMYQDANGRYWYRYASSPGKWTTPGSDAYHHHDAPMRPLRGPLHE